MSIELLPERGIDLRCHSLFSDGCKTPAELLDMAMAKNLQALALTDHDTTSGLADFQALNGRGEIELINGIEISSRYQNREVHIVGLYIDICNVELQSFLSEIRRQRDIRNEQIAIKLHHLGYDINLAELNSLGLDDKSIGRPHFARALVAHYGFESEYIVFEQLLKRGAPAYEPRHLPMPTEVIKMIHNAGGVAIWAHPICREPRDRNWTRKALRYFRENGLDGIEAYYSTFTPEQRNFVLRTAENFPDMAVSGGSDYHGRSNETLELGWGGLDRALIPGSILSKLKEIAQKYQS